MTVIALPPEALKKSVFDLVSECREGMKMGRPDMSKVEKMVRAYCESVSSLPEEEAKHHRQDLNELMELISKLGDELVAARENVRQELTRLEGLRKASIAYQHSDGIGRSNVIAAKDDDGQ